MFIIRNLTPKLNSLQTLMSFWKNLLKNIECLYIVGHMNIDLLKQDSLTEKYTNILINHGVDQIIAEATSINERSSTLIDHIIYNRNVFLISEIFQLL